MAVIVAVVVAATVAGGGLEGCEGDGDDSDWLGKKGNCVGRSKVVAGAVVDKLEWIEASEMRMGVLAGGLGSRGGRLGWLMLGWLIEEGRIAACVLVGWAPAGEQLPAEHVELVGLLSVLVGNVRD